MFALSISTAVSASTLLNENARPTRCSAAEETQQLGRTAKPPPMGVALLLGVRTGMDRDDVRRIHSRLAAMTPGGEFELLPGVLLAANVNFDGRPSRAVSVEMRGHRRFQEAIASLTEHYGRPIVRLGSTRYVDIPIAGSVATRQIDNASLRWCDAGRIIQLSGNRESFRVTISASRE